LAKAAKSKGAKKEAREERTGLRRCRWVTLPEEDSGLAKDVLGGGRAPVSLWPRGSGAVRRTPVSEGGSIIIF